MSEELKVTITLNEQQANTLSFACESISRLMLGQFHHTLNEICHRKGLPITDYDELEYVENYLKHLFYPELESNAYFGIHNESVDNKARTLFDIHQVIRNALSWYRNPLGGWTVNYDEVHVTDTVNDPPKVTLDTGDPNYEIYLSFFKRLNHSINQMIDKRGWKDEDVERWIISCKQFALHEHHHIKSTNTPLPSEQYLEFFNEYVDDDGYVKWKEDE